MILFLSRTLLLVFLASHLVAVGAPLEKVRTLHAEVARLEGAQPKAALAKVEDALALLALSPEPRLEMELLLQRARLQSRTGSTSDARRSMERGDLLAKSLGDGARQRAFGALRADILRREGNNTEATRIAQQVLKEAQAAQDLPSAAKALSVLGECAGELGNFPQGIQYIHQALELSERMNDPHLRQVLLSVLSNFYMQTLDWEKALKANADSTLLARELGDAPRLGLLFLNASNIHNHLNQPEEQYRALKEAEALARKAGNTRLLMATEANLSDVLLQRKDYRGAIELADRALTEGRKLGDQRFKIVALANRGIALNRLGQHEAGLASLEAALKDEQNGNSAGGVVELLGVLSEEWAFAGDLTKALEFHQAFKKKSDSLFNDARTKTVQELDARYKSQKQEQQIAQLKAESQRRMLVRNFSILGGLLGLALAAALLARYRLLRRSSAQMEALNKQLEMLSITDPLTGLRNRRFFMQHVDQDTVQADRAHQTLDSTHPAKEGNRDLLFFIVDLDHFKQVNDTYGHQVGDLVLTQAVARLKSAIRESDELIRWGGEEFLLAARQTRREDAHILAERLRAAVAAAPFDLGENRSLVRTCSIGFAAYPFLLGAPGRPNWEAVVDLADQALYAAKASGRNGWVGALGAESATPVALESALGSGLRGLVEQGLCEIRCSFPDPATLVWGAENGEAGGARAGSRPSTNVAHATVPEPSVPGTPAGLEAPICPNPAQEKA